VSVLFEAIVFFLSSSLAFYFFLGLGNGSQVTMDEGGELAASLKLPLLRRAQGELILEDVLSFLFSSFFRIGRKRRSSRQAQAPFSLLSYSPFVKERSYQQAWGCLYRDGNKLILL
jgi:hypothetical protein